MEKSLSQRQYDKGIWNPQVIASAVNEMVSNNDVKGIAVAIVHKNTDKDAEYLTYDDNGLELIGAVEEMKICIMSNLDEED